MRRMGVISVLAGALCACAAPSGADTAPDPLAKAESAQRIVSLDFCADQYVLKLVGRDRILALSPDATADFSYMRDSAHGLPTVRPLAEDALVLGPDLVVRSFGGGPGAGALFERAGVPVLQLGWAGDLEGIRRVVTEVGAALGEEEKAAQVVANVNARLAALQSGLKAEDRHSALYLTPGGVTTGPGSLVDELMREAGLINFETDPGWRSIPLERLTREQPDLVAAAFFDDPSRSLDPWSAMRHPVARAQLIGRTVVDIDSAWLACGGWFALDALEALIAAAQ